MDGDQYTDLQREFCLETYCLNRCDISVVRRLYRDEFSLEDMDECPSAVEIKNWVRIQKGGEAACNLKQTKKVSKYTKLQRDFCLETYYLNRCAIAAVTRLYCKKFNLEDMDECPSADEIKNWVRIYEESLANKMKQTEEDSEYTKADRQFCIEKYHSNRGNLIATQRSYCDKINLYFHEDGYNALYCPTKAEIKKWVRTHEESKAVAALKMKRAEESQEKLSKLPGTQWGRKTGENRIIRTESIDIGLQQQAIKWQQRDVKWSGPRTVIEKEIVKPVEEENYYYDEESENELEPDKRKQRDVKWNGPRAVIENEIVKPVEEEKYYYNDQSENQLKLDKKIETQEKFEEKVLELIESLNARANAARVSAFVSLRAALQRRALDDLLAAHRATLADHVSRALRRGKDGERKAAAAIAPLLALQIGEEGTEEFVREVRPALAATATDKSASLDTRTECCLSLAVLCYLMKDDLTEILEAMRMFETIFSGSYLKGDGGVKVPGAAVEEGAWHAAALDGWALLLPLLGPSHALSLLHNHAPSFARLGRLLEAVSLELRMAVGGALAIAYETVTDDDSSDSSEHPLAADVDALLPRLSELALDSHKFRAKRDRKIQRATFRDILKYLEEGEVSCTSVRVGTETASWSSWRGGAAYAALAGALGGALQALAPRCSRLRAALALSDVLPEDVGPYQKLNKLQRNLQNNAARKARTVARNKNRDKRSAALAV